MPFLMIRNDITKVAADAIRYCLNTIRNSWVICRLPVDLLPSGLWYPFANESDTPQNGGNLL